MAWALRTDADIDTANVDLAALETAGLTGMSEAEGRATLWFAHRVDDLPVQGRWEEVTDQDWQETWKAGLAPVTVGGITVTPPWLPVEGAIVIEPGQAFGTGHHETTTACLAAMQALDLAGLRVADIGTGTGVLAIAAATLGAARVAAVDTDPLAVAAARANAAANAADVTVRLGSADLLETGAFDVVVANLDTATLRAVAEDLVALLAPGGTLVVSGISLERTAEAVTALAAAGLTARGEPGKEWVLITGRRT